MHSRQFLDDIFFVQLKEEVWFETIKAVQWLYFFFGDGLCSPRKQQLGWVNGIFLQSSIS